jgi:hypothetical protein
MGEAGRGCWYATPFSIIPDRGQVAENSSKPGTKEAWDVFQQQELASQLASEAHHLTPEASSLAINADALAPLSLANAGVLTREACGDDAGVNPIGSEPCGGEGSHVIVAGNLRPMFRQHALAEWIDLAERDGLEPARALQAKVKPANASEQGEDAQHQRASAIVD